MTATILLAPATAIAQMPTTHIPVLRDALQAADMALVINENDPASVETGAYYQTRRLIPDRNVIRVRFPAHVPALTQAEFEKLYQDVQRQLPATVQAYALAWTQPYRAGCMGITSAFAFGFDPAYCSTNCGATRASPYFDAASGRPWSDHGLRPAMLLAGRTPQEVRALIDRGIDADYAYPGGTAYLASTSDKARNVRAAGYPAVIRRIGGVIHVAPVEGVLRERKDIIAYFTGLATVPGLDTLGFRPGAAADHLTSYGGVLTDSPQMSALEWLAAGATASYGTVTEPCAHPQKFPSPGVFLLHYLDGDSLIEAYWKSVAWPGEGVFIGEPLARPYGMQLRMGQEGWVLEAHTAIPGRRYTVRAGTLEEPGRTLGIVGLRPGHNRIALPPLNEAAVIDPYPVASGITGGR